MTDTSRYEGWLMSRFDIDDYSRDDMKKELSKNYGFSSMKKTSQRRILDNWKEFDSTIEPVEITEKPIDIEQFPDVPEPSKEPTPSFWKKVRKVFVSEKPKSLEKILEVKEVKEIKEVMPEIPKEPTVSFWKHIRNIFRRGK